MKFLKGLFVFLFVLVLLVFVGAYVFLQSFDINKYRPQIVAEISKQLGRNVAIDKLGLNLSLFNGVYAQVVGLKVSEDPGFGQGDFASIGAVNLNVDVLAYLSRREIVVSKVVVEALNVTIIRDQAGLMNIQKIGPSENQSAVLETSPSSAPKQQSAPVAIPNFSIKTITLADAAVMFIDKGQNPPMQLAVSKVDFTVKDFSLNQPFGFEGKAAVFGADKNLTIAGQAAINATAQEAQLNQVVVEFDLAKLKVADLMKAVPSLASAGLKENLSGKITVKIPALTAGAKGMGTLAVSGKLQDGQISTQFLPVAVEKIAADFTADAKDIDVSSFSLQLLTGTVTGKAKILDYMASQELRAECRAIAVPLSSLVAGLPQGMKLGGSLNADLAIGGQNLANPDKFLNSLSGSGQFAVDGGKVENFNLLKTVLGRIEFIPGLATLVEANIPQQYRGEYQSNETVFEKISSTFKITDGVADLPDFVVLANLFEADMQIKADTKLNGKVSGQIKLPLDLSEYLVSQAKELAYLKNSDGKIVLPLTSFEGPLTSLKIVPDMKALGKAALEGEGRNQINKLINKALKVDDGTNLPGENSAPAPEKELINGVLDKIFK